MIPFSARGDEPHDSQPRLRAAKKLPMLFAWNLPDVIHGFMTREGGVSTGPYRSLNLAEWVGDDADAVRANWVRWRASYPEVPLARLRQVHGNRVYIIGPGHGGGPQAGDGMATAQRGLALAVFTADCVPVLMVDPERAIVAALHAGWRGTLANVANAGVAAMRQLGAHPHRIRVALGPSIGLCCFEIDVQLAEHFAAKLPYARGCHRPGRPGKMYLDLRAINRLQLQRAGLMPDAISNVGPCTQCANLRFFSRRAAGGMPTGLQMSFVGLRAED